MATSRSKARLRYGVLASLTGLVLGLSGSPASAGSINPFSSTPLFVGDSQAAAAAALARQNGDELTARKLDKIAQQPQAMWFGDWVPTTQIRASVDRHVTRAAQARRLDVLVLYAIPHRDCGGVSGGGLKAAGYRSWILEVVRGLRSRRTAVILEPDALAQIRCLPSTQRTERIALLRDAARSLTAAGAVVYVDAGHAGWPGAFTMASRLKAVGVGAAGSARGMSVNVAGFGTTAAQVSYAHQIASLLPGVHAVVDTSRNGLGPTSDAAWCNPGGRALGIRPRAAQDSVVDALLWVKRPGESDGACSAGAPPAGQFWTSYAVGLAERAGW